VPIVTWSAFGIDRTKVVAPTGYGPIGSFREGIGSIAR
jgi:hypothetical protein